MLKEFQKYSVVITDTSCFILLDKINALEILQSVYKNVVTTPEIAAEFGKPLPDWILIKAVKNKQRQFLYSGKVDAGEASAIALAMELPSPLLILDDLKGRNLASQLNLSYTGTLGLLVLAKNAGIIKELKGYFDKIADTDFRVSPALLQTILEKSGE